MLLFAVACVCLACVVIYFDQYFMTNLCKCYLGDTLCCAIRGISDFTSNYYQTILTNCTTVLTTYGSSSAAFSAISCAKTPTSKLVYIQAQLGVAVGMIVVCAVYIVVYLFACFGICFKPKK